VSRTLMPDSPRADESAEGAGRAADLTPPLGTRIDPRLRARRIAVQRQAGRRRLRWSFVAGAVVLLIAVLFGLSYTPLVAVSRVDVDGVVETDPALLQSVVDSTRGSAIVWLDLASVRRRLEADPWVRKVRVSRDWPHTIRIEVVERRPVASFAGPDNQVRVVDGDGRVLAVLSGLPADYPFLAVNAPNLDAGSDAPPAVLAGIAVAKVLPDELRGRIKQLDVSDAGEVQIELVPSGKVIIGAPSELRDKLVTLLTVLHKCGSGTPPDTIDVQVPSKPSLTPEGACG
jgi:cell division protein FtsQ